MTSFSLSGKNKIQLRKRLGEDWDDLATHFEIPMDRRRRFTSGRECDGILTWLEERRRLNKLPAALKDIDRDDLIELLQESTESAGEAAVESWPGSPFPGLRRFNPEDAPIFFGRWRDTKGLIRKLADPASRFIAVMGASGSGKSSLVAAGLLPQLQHNAIPGGRDWPWLEFRPSGAEGDPFPSLATRLESLLRHQGLHESKILKMLREDYRSGLSELAQRVLAAHPEHAELLLFIDQFEELFTLTREDLRQSFVAMLTKTARTQRVRIVVAMRADFFQRCLGYPKLADLLRTGSYPLASPGPGALYEMITGPAAKAGLEFQEGLVQRILDDTGTGSGALALMAFALDELYEAKKEDGRLTDQAYERFGGVKQAVSQRAEDTFKNLDGAVQATLGDVFRELVQVDARGVATRRRARLSEIDAASHTLLNAFVDARLLVRRPGEDDLPVVEVAHEALLIHWPRLQEWVEVRRDDLRLRRQVQLAAAEWEHNGCADAYLWPDERLKPVQQMIQRLRPNLSDVEQAFLRPELERLVEELKNPATLHQRRAAIGERLFLIGDTRPGVGLREDGLPDIVWCPVPGGEITLKDHVGTFTVEPFYIAKYPVTYLQYRSFLEATDGYSNERWWRGLAQRQEKPGEQRWKMDNHPAENVSWFAAVAFCRWLSARLGYEIRLPTEWQWQQAATGGDPANEYPWGGEWDARRANTFVNGLGRTTAVGMYPQGVSPVGARDMSGNVMEWCLNKGENSECVDLFGESERVVRGGSWTDLPKDARAAFRYRKDPSSRSGITGLRVVYSSSRVFQTAEH